MSAAEEFLQSNIIIASKFATPQTGEIRKLHASLLGVENRLKRLTNPTKPWTIKLEVDDSALKRFNLMIQQQQQNTPGTRNAPSQNVLGGAAGRVTSRRVTRTIGEEGTNSLAFQEKRESIAGNVLRTETEINDVVKKTTKTSAEEVSLAEKALVTEKKLHTETKLRQGAAARAAQDQERLAQRAQIVSTGNRQLSRMGLGRPLQATPQEIVAFERRSLEKRKEALALHQQAERDDLKKKEELEKARERIYDTAERRDLKNKQTLVKNQERVVEQAERKDLRNRQALLEKQFQGEAKRGGVGFAVQQAEAAGFTRRPDTRTFNALNNTMETTHNLIRTTGNAWSGYTVEILKANEATGKVTSSILQGSQAAKFLGDSFVRSTAKIALWSAAMLTVVATARGIGEAAVQVKELEENTVLLARVSRGFGGGNRDFEDRLEIAQELTSQIIELTTVYGGNAAEAVKAAAVFGRAGRDQQETLQGVRASLLAARIAELDVTEASQLLSSAMLQFNLRSRDLLPTLDSLNSLSNNYRVTTNDLLQSISRTGSVFADQNGRLTELAAITTVVSQTTSRTGAEIGNAFKTVSSNLDRLDVQQSVFEKLGIATVDYAGNARSLGKVLLDLQVQMDTLSVSEQRQLTLQIAGVRQRNILLAAINNASEAVSAENKALLEAGSAEEEFVQRSSTLNAALERIVATFTQFASILGGPFLAIIKPIINLADVILRLTTSFNGLFLKLAAGATIFALVRAGVAILTAQLTGLARQVQATVVEIQRMSFGLIFLSRVTNGVSNSWAALISRTNLLTLAIVGITYVLGQAAESNNVYSQSLSTLDQQMNANIANEERRRQAVINTIETIGVLLQQERKLQQAGQSGAIPRNQARRVIQSFNRSSDPQKNFNLSSGNFSFAQAAQEATRLAKASVQAEIKERQRLAQQIGIKSGDARSRLTALESERASGGGFSRRAATGNQFILRQIGAELFGGADEQRAVRQERHAEIIKRINADIAVAQNEISKNEQERAEQSQKIADLKQIELIFTQRTNDLQNSLRSIQIDRFRAIELERATQVDQFRVSLNQTTEAKSQADQYRAVSTESQKQAANLTRIAQLTKNISQELVSEEDYKRVNDLLTKQAELYQKIQQSIAQSSQGSFGDILSSRNKVQAGAAQISLQRQRGLSTKFSTFGNEIAEIDLARQQNLNRIQNNQAAAKQLAGSDLGPAAKAGAARALQEDTQQAINDLRDQEVQKALAILEAEKNIALERKKSADEAARALGTLSDEDKLRVRAQAAFLAQKPNKRFSFEEQFRADANTNRILQTFFPGRLQGFSEAKGQTADIFRRAGLGQTEDIQRGTQEVNRARGGRSDLSIINGALGRAGGLIDQGRGLSGAAGGNLGIAGFASGILGRQGVGGAAGHIPTSVDVRLQKDSFDFTPLITSFEKAVTVQLDEAIQTMAGRVEEILRQRDRINALRKPRIVSGGS